MHFLPFQFTNRYKKNCCVKIHSLLFTMKLLHVAVVSCLVSSAAAHYSTASIIDVVFDEPKSVTLVRTAEIVREAYLDRRGSLTYDHKQHVRKRQSSRA